MSDDTKQTQEVNVTRPMVKCTAKNGKIVAKLTNPYQNRVDTAKSLFGILPKDVSLEDAKEERLNAK